MGAEAAQHRGVSRLVDAVTLAELGDQPEDLRAAPRGARLQRALQVQHERLVIHETGHLAYRGGVPIRAVYRTAGRPVAASMLLPIRSKLLICVSRS